MLENQFNWKLGLKCGVRVFKGNWIFDNQLSKGKLIKALGQDYLGFKGCVLKKKG